MNKTSHLDEIISKIHKQSSQNLHHSSPNLSITKTNNYHYQKLHKRLLSSVYQGIYSPTQNGVVSTLKEKLGKRIKQYNTCEDASSFQDLKHIKVLESCLTIECANCSEFTFTSFLRILERMEQLEQSFKIVLFAELKKTFLLLANKIQSDIDILSQHILNLNSDMQVKNEEILQLKNSLKQTQKTRNENFQQILNTLRQKKKDQHKINGILKPFAHSDNVETCKQKHDINEPVEEEELKFSSQEDSFPFVDPSTLDQPIYKTGISLNLKPVKKKAPKGYQDEFMAQMNEFSESWRQQALVEKRF